MTVDQLHVRLSWALRDHALSGWELGFAKGFVGRCKRGRDVSDRQIRCARRILDGLRAEPLIDAEDR